MSHRCRFVVQLRKEDRRNDQFLFAHRQGNGWDRNGWVLPITLDDGAAHKGDDDHAALLDWFTSEFVRTKGYSANGRNGRIETVGLVYDRSRDRKAIGKTLERTVKLGAGGLRSAVKSSNKILRITMNRNEYRQWNTLAQQPTDRRSSIMLQFD